MALVAKLPSYFSPLSSTPSPILPTHQGEGRRKEQGDEEGGKSSERATRLFPAITRGFSFTPSFISSPIARSSVVTKDLNLKVEKERRATEGDSISSEHPPSHLLLFFFLFSPSHFTASLHFSIIARAPLRSERGYPPACGLLLFISFVFPSHN